MKSDTVIIIRNAYTYDFGGGERFPVLLAHELLSTDYRPIVVSRHEKLLDFAKDNDVQTVRGLWWSKQNWSGRSALLLPAYAAWQIVLTLWYLGLFIRLKPGVVHAQSKDDFIAATIAGRLVGARVVWTDHADLKHVWSNTSAAFRNPVGKMVLYVAKFADTITVVSESERKYISDELTEDSALLSKIRVVHNGSPDRLASVRGSETSDKKSFRFVVASRLVVDKGIAEAIDAFRLVHSKHPETELIIVGDGPDRQEFEKLASNESSSIKFMGHMSDPLAIMKSGDVFLQPTYHEGFSVVLVEACMLELPIIATDVGGNPEIIRDMHNGLLVPPKDSRSLARAMLRLYEDSDLRANLAANARAVYLEGFVFEDIVKNQFVPIYRGEVDENSSRD